MRDIYKRRREDYRGEKTRSNTSRGRHRQTDLVSIDEMVFNSFIVVSVAHVSADMWQHVACLPERLSSRQVLDLVCFIPLQELGRLALCVWSFICIPPPPHHFSPSPSDDDSDSEYQSSATVDYDDYYYHPHSD